MTDLAQTGKKQNNGKYQKSQSTTGGVGEAAGAMWKTTQFISLSSS